MNIDIGGVIYQDSDIIKEGPFVTDPMVGMTISEALEYLKQWYPGEAQRRHNLGLILSGPDVKEIIK